MTLSWIAVFLLMISSLFVLISQDWRRSLAAMLLMYLGMFILVAQQWPLGMAVVKLVVGWMSSAALALTQLGREREKWYKITWSAQKSFRLLSAGIVFLVVFSSSSKILSWFPDITQYQEWGGFILIGIGLLNLGMTTTPFYTVLSLLMVLAGFEIFYAAVEVSVLVAGLLAGVNLGLALIGTYLNFPRAPKEFE